MNDAMTFLGYGITIFISFFFGVLIFIGIVSWLKERFLQGLSVMSAYQIDLEWKKIFRARRELEAEQLRKIDWKT